MFVQCIATVTVKTKALPSGGHYRGLLIDDLRDTLEAAEKVRDLPVKVDQHVFFKGRIASALVDSAALCSVSIGVLVFEFER